MLILVFFQLPAFGQMDQGRIVGVVTDANGAIVPGVSVTAKNNRTGEERTATTNQDGTYIIAGLRPSAYTITATGQNLTIRASNVQVLAGQELNLPLALQATGVEAKVDVTATADTALDSNSASMSVNVNPREVKALPLNGRQLSSFICRRQDPLTVARVLTVTSGSLVAR
jgi:hypothetical protein